MVSQLRIYTINRGKLDNFVEGWKKFVYPLHYHFGFTNRLRRQGLVHKQNRRLFVFLVTIYPWNDTQEHIDETVEHARRFLNKHEPIKV